MNWINELQQMDFRGGKSQFGESGIIKFIFENIKPTNKFFVDIGAGFYGHGQMSNTQELIDNGWKGLQIDADNSDNQNIKQLYVTPENIIPFLKEHEVPEGFDFLNIDIDSFDLDILERVVPAFRPRVICTEFNGTLDPELSIKLKYEEGYIWDETSKYGYSFGAAIKFCNKHDCKIILNYLNQNLFLARWDLVCDVPIVTADQIHYHPWNENAEWVEYE